MSKKIPYSLPLAPMIPWMKERVEKETAEVFAQRLGISDRRIREAISGRAHKMSFEMIDRIITNEGTVNFIDFYPEYDDDEEFFKINKSEKYGIVIAPKKTCTVEGCESSMHAKGLCGKHYRRYQKGKMVAA